MLGFFHVSNIYCLYCAEVSQAEAAYKMQLVAAVMKSGDLEALMLYRMCCMSQWIRDTLFKQTVIAFYIHCFCFSGKMKLGSVTT